VIVPELLAYLLRHATLPSALKGRELMSQEDELEILQRRILEAKKYW
jgi:hypothetical protein